MAHWVLRKKKYWTLEMSVRVPGKRTPRKVILQRLSPKKAADERYREVLRQNVYLYGRGRPGERYLREAQAREQYQREMLALNRGEVASNRFEPQPRSPFEARSAMYAVSHPSAQSRAKAEYADLKETARAENAREEKASYPPKGAPTDEEEAMHAQWSENQAAQRDEDSADYGDPISEAEAAAGGPGGGPEGEGES